MIIKYLKEDTQSPYASPYSAELEALLIAVAKQAAKAVSSVPMVYEVATSARQAISVAILIKTETIQINF